MKELSRNAQTVCKKRYFLPGEDAETMWQRIAKAVAKAEDKNKKETGKYTKDEAEKLFFEVLSNLEFVPNSPTIHGAGQPNACLSACFVLPIEDSMKSIFTTLMHSAIVHQFGGGTGFSFTNIRSKHSNVGPRKGVAGGPVSFMEIFDKAAETVTQTGLRKGANMGVIRVDHPDIREFIHAKSDHTRLNNFNLSVAITDKFMKAVKDDTPFDLVTPHTKETVETVSARDLWNEITKLAWEGGDPGVFFIDTANKKSPFKDIQIESTNPWTKRAAA